ncbi:hypothetical protein OSB04_010246 [Centaurea solstitialis]|uniref:Protein NO VEIN C-terminal domain-containing protein n=1 Tax=Centaurea solstitialis TaxID=347529 RepID=A0AA38WCN0_9ASTR|nr:hypothetical protein OSB04_010246 [Centaurea solstitialis]
MQGNYRRPGFAGISSNNAESPSQVIARIDGAAVKAHSDLLAAGESVSAWRVAQLALVLLKAASFESLGFRMQNVPSLNRLMLTEAKVNSFIHCFVGVQKLTSLHELEMAICESEGIKGFEELELGPILKHPLVVHYFSIGCDVTEMLKITSEQIVAYLGILLRKRKKVIVDDLLDYIAKRTNQSRGNLCIRIQSLGMHISHIMRGRRSEITLLKKCSEGLDVGLKLDGNEDDAGDNAKDEDNNDNDDVHDFGILSSQIATGSHSSAADQVPRIWQDTLMDYSLTSRDRARVTCCTIHVIHKSLEYWNLGVKFKPEFLKDNVETGFIGDNAIDGNTWMFIKTWKDTCEKHNVDEAFDQMLEFYSGPMKPKKKEKDINKMITSYPHAGLLNVAITSMKFGLWNSLDSIPQANNKEVLANTNSKTCAFGADTHVESAEKNVVVASKHVVDGITWMFINTWKDICEKHNVLEVFDKMLDFYPPRMKPKRKTNTLKTMTSSYPHVGLLNVAPLSGCREYKCCLAALLDRIYKVWFVDHMSSASQANKNEVLANTDFKTAEKDALVANKHVLEGRVDVALEDVQKFIKEYFMSSNHVPDNMDSYPKKELIFLREIHKLERWLAEKFSIDVFEALGFGEFFSFLEDHVSLLPTAWQNCFSTTDKSEKPSVKVCMSDRYLLEFLSEAASSLGEHETLNKLMVSELLRMQYPSAGLVLIEDDFTADLLTTLSKNGGNVGSNNVLFSSTLSSYRAEKGFTDAHLDTKNAVELLLRAPMLVDLALWSHWDYKFAPSLGPLLGWLLSDVKTKELFCLVTTNGEILRVDHSATVDSFFEVFLHGSSFQTAVMLLSLIALYGGERNLPFSLLKRHAKDAFEIMLKISSDKVVKDDRRLSLASRFVIDCLGHIPKEFRRFAAELLVSAFRSIIKDAHMVILSECKCKEDHLMLHEVGLLLGIVEWFDDHCTCLSASKESLEDHKSKGFSSKDEVIPALDVSQPNKDCERDSMLTHGVHNANASCIQPLSVSEREKNAAKIIESIRIEEFGLDPNLSITESSILKKQHARLGRALHCLSQELYSQDSHFLLELVQNADDNAYPRNVEPTLTFILQEKSIVVLNNEHGFSAENIRALCDVGNSTKKSSGAGYIGKKGIGFKSVFRVTDAPEIHSNGFHIKFDLSEGQIGFVLPTIVPPCDIDLFSNLVSLDTAEQVNLHQWNTCIVLPFKSKLTEASVENITSMFSDLHPSLLLFLHRLQCIKFRNTLNDSFVTMRKEIIGNGLINVSIGKETLTWFVESRKLHANSLRNDATTTEISVAFSLESASGNDDYVPKMDQQYVFAFLPLRTYGLKFIIQGDFILPSSREEVDGDSPWNQWLLSEFPSLFVDSERSFCSLPGFRDFPGKGVSVFLSYVPLVGEVHGFFASLPRMIISKLCTSNCLLLEGDNDKWVPPCRVLRNWNEEVRNLLPDSLIQTHLGLGYLNKDIVLSDSLARALGIENYGPRILVQMLSSLCRTKEGLRSMGFSWLSSWLNALHGMHDLDESGCFLPTSSNENNLEAFSRLFTNLRVVNPALFDGSVAENLIQILSKVGVQRLSAHQVVKVHILPAVCDQKNTKVNKDLMTEYLSFIMVHLQSSCPDCAIEREHIISEVYNKAWILTNHGFVLPAEVAIHFGKDFGNQIDMGRLINGTDVKWYEVDNTYLNYPTARSTSGGMLYWRKFLQELQVTDFVQVVQIEKTVSISSQFVPMNMTWEKVVISPGSTVSDWESRELVDLLTSVSSSGDWKKCKYLLEILDAKWDGCFSDKVVAYCNTDGESKAFKSSLVSSLNDVQWVASSVDRKLYYPKELFYDCEAVCSILGDNAPYAIPKIQSEKLVSSIGLKTAVTFDDALSVLEVWKGSATSFKASVSQMSRFYSFIWNELASSNQKNVASLCCGAFIFIPFSSSVSSSEVEPGVLLSPQDVYWHDSMIHPDQREFSKMLCNLYPSLHDFFVNECGVKENPPLLDYLKLLRHLSTVDTPLEAAKKVFDVFVMWSDGLKSGLLSLEDVEMLKKYLERKQMKVLPTAQDRWVSLHSSFGLVCWCDDEKLADEFEGLNNIDFLRLCELSDEEKEMLQVKVSLLMKTLGIPALSEVVTREAIYYGPVDNGYETSLVSWVLPYAQRYISNSYPERYLQLKLSGFEKLNRLQIIVVEKLFYKNVIRRSNQVSKKRHDISCLLQDDILYATHESDSHSLFMELSCFLINGIPELHLANFLHMVTSMIESGSTVEQIETFILNSQKVPKLMDEEPVWSILPPGPIESSATARLTKRKVKRSRTRQSNRNPPPASSKTIFNFHSSHVNDPEMPQDVAKKIESTDQLQNVEPSSSSNTISTSNRSNRNWPPAGWKTAPEFIYSHVNDLEAQQDIAKQIDLNAGSIEEHIISTDQVQNVEPFTNDEDHGGTDVAAGLNAEPGSVDQDGSCSFSQKDRLSHGTVNGQQALITGRHGEEIAFDFYSKKFGKKAVKWVNEVRETGLPYDIEVCHGENRIECIEVKTTDSRSKDWFEISVGEWQFAVEKGEFYSIARVVLSGGKTDRVTVFKNPAKLCRNGHLKLAVLMPKQQEELVVC